MRLAAFCGGSASRMITRDRASPEIIAACIVRKSRNVQTSFANKQPSDAQTKIARPEDHRSPPTLSDKGPINSCSTVVVAA